LDGGAVLHGDNHLAGVRYGEGLVDEEVVDDVLEDHHGLRQQAVPGGVLVEARDYPDVVVPVLGQLVPGRGEPVSRGDLGDEPGVRQELHPRLDVLGELLELGVGHLGKGRSVGLHELRVLLGRAEGLGELLGVRLQGGDQVPVALPDDGPLGPEVGALADGRHLVGADLALQLVLLHLHEEAAVVLLDDHGLPVAEDDVQALEGGLLQVAQVAAEGAIDHVHEGALAVPVGGVDEVQALLEV